MEVPWKNPDLRGGAECSACSLKQNHPLAYEPGVINESNSVVCNYLLLLCHLHVVLTCDILPGRHALHLPVVLQVLTELTCYHGICMWLLTSWRGKKPGQPSSPLCPALFKSALSLLAQLASAWRCRARSCRRRGLKPSVQQGFNNGMVLLKKSCWRVVRDATEAGGGLGWGGVIRIFTAAVLCLKGCSRSTACEG